MPAAERVSKHRTGTSLLGKFNLRRRELLIQRISLQKIQVMRRATLKQTSQRLPAILGSADQSPLARH
ncbi:hypothetical protein VTK56DRAFT_374 [Thermocarpiscus australiensis]